MAHRFMDHSIMHTINQIMIKCAKPYILDHDARNYRIPILCLVEKQFVES